MSYFLNEEQLLMQSAIREFAQGELQERAAEIDKTGEFPMDIWARCAELGLTGVTVPEEYDGLGADITTEMMMMEELGKVSPAIGLMLDAHLFALALIQRSGNEEMKQKYLADGASGRKIFALSATDPAGASNVPDWTMFAAETEDGFVLNGNKIFCTNSHVADVYVCMSLTATGLSNFIVEKGTPGLGTGAFEHKIGMHGVNSGCVTYDNVKVPKNHIMGYPTDPHCNVAILHMSMISIGAAETALEKTVEYLRNRTRQGKSLLSRGAISTKLFKIAADIEMAKGLIYTAARLLDEDRGDVRLHFMAKAYIPEMMTQDIAKCIELHGAVGYSEDTGLSLLFRDALGCMIADGAATGSSVQGSQAFGWETQD
jgi:alkylation response protein AidB-like acyl-CoA dehydrogenase